MKALFQHPHREDRSHSPIGLERREWSCNASLGFESLRLEGKEEVEKPKP